MVAALFLNPLTLPLYHHLNADTYIALSTCLATGGQGVVPDVAYHNKLTAENDGTKLKNCCCSFKINILKGIMYIYIYIIIKNELLFILDTMCSYMMGIHINLQIILAAGLLGS